MHNTQLHYTILNTANYTTIEKQILQYWHNFNIFEQSIRGDDEYVFYDGPPFANGLPHYGHILTGFIKDTIARYHTMLGKKVERKFGWDCHGLPAEMAAEKELGISGKYAIDLFGVEKFNQHCKNSVLRYTAEWEYYVKRQARWVDFVNDYKTMNISFMESVIWAFKTLYDKGLIYESMRVMPYSWACQTPVSDFETRIDNSYRQKQSNAITVTFKLLAKPYFIPTASIRLVVWTTTPWTLPSNLAIAVGATIKYVCIVRNDIGYIIAEALAYKYQEEIGNNIVARFSGEQLVGLKYEPLFRYFIHNQNAFQILNGDFVNTEEGTGIVHIAPGFGEDDQILCAENNIDLVCPVDEAGCFIHPVDDYLGKQVFDANDDIIITLKKQGNWIRTEQYWHNYPHCWRTDTPLIYKAIPSWYVKVTAIKEKIIANNQKINWIPGHIRDGIFGKWIENARDWAISRNRYFGCPIPVWKSDDPRYPHIEVYGSIKELEEAFGVSVSDLHKPFIDTLTKVNPKDPTGRSKLRRVSDVLDCWFESGSVPYAQVHYPFENKEHFEKHFPADFVVEYISQTRGWFYTLIVLSTAIFDRPPFLNCICHGVLLGEGGQKLSKRLKNYADPQEVFENVGADAMRWFMLSSAVMHGQEILVDRNASGAQEALRLIIRPILNAYNFFALYANADGVKVTLHTTAQNVQRALDRYILIKCQETINTIKYAIDHYNIAIATTATEKFFELLTNWYIRRSRERFWRNAKDVDKLQAYNTLYSVLLLMSRACAPMLPLLMEAIYLSLNGIDISCISADSSSIHLTNFPTTAPLIKTDIEFITNMERVREACNVALRIRNEFNIRIRQPLHKVIFIGVAQYLDQEMTQLILDEINIKHWENISADYVTKYANYKLYPALQLIGKRIPQHVKRVIASSKTDDWSLSGDTVMIGDIVLFKEEYEIKLEPKAEFKGIAYPLPSNDALVILETTITPELLEEGIARDIVRLIQHARKQAALNIADHINVVITISSNTLYDAIHNWREYIRTQTLCIELNTRIEEHMEQMIEHTDDEQSSHSLSSNKKCSYHISGTIEKQPVNIQIIRAN